MTLADILALLPQAADLSRGLGELDEIDLLISVSGFEPRLDAVALALRDASVVVHRGCYLTYDANDEANTRTRESLLRSLRDLTTAVEPLDADSSEEEFIAGLREIVASSSRADSEPPVVVLDISVASSRLLARCIHTLLHEDIRLVVAYAQAEIYYPTQEEFAQWKAERDAVVIETADSVNAERRYDLGATPDTTLGLDHGAASVEFLKDFRVQHLETLPDRVIVFPAYNGARARLFLADIDTSLLDNHPDNDAVTWLVGDPLLDHDKWRFHAMAAANSLVNPDGSTHDKAQPVTTFDYIDVIRQIGLVYERNFGREKVTICAMGSKMQNLGALLFCELHGDVRLGHALPETYTAGHYSDGVTKVWSIDFGETAGLRERFATYGTASIVG